MQKVRTPDGQIASFPDGMGQDEIAQVMRRQYGGSEQGGAERAGGLDQLWQGLLHDVKEAPQAALSTGKQMVGEAGDALSDLWQSLLPTKAGAQAGGRILERVGGLLDFATGGLAGPELPPAGRLSAKIMKPRTPAQETFQDFGKLGMTPNIPTITQRPPLVPIFNPLKAIPLSPIEKGLQQNVGQAGQAMQRVADQFGPAIGAEQAGRTAQEAIKAFAEDREQTALDYGEFYRLMHGAKPADVTSTVRVLKDLYGRYPSAPRLSELFTNSKLGTMLQEIAPRIQRVEPRMSGFGGDTVMIPGGTITTRGRLTIPELKDLHTRVRYMMSEPAIGPESIPKADLVRVYKALSADLQRAAQQRGPEALEALQRANDHYRARQQIIERLESITKADAPERAFARLNAAAQGTSAADIGMLQTARDVIPPEQWKDIGAAMIRRLGFPAGREGPHDLGPDFSLKTFKENWDKLTPKAKDTLFGESFPGTPRDTLETIARMGANKALTTFSRPGHFSAAHYLAVEGLLRSATTGRSALPEVAGLTGVYGLSKLLMSPNFARMVYRDRMMRPAPTPIPQIQSMRQAQGIGQLGAAASARSRPDLQTPVRSIGP